MTTPGRRAYVHRHHVPFEETNLAGNVYFAHYVRWQGHCRERFLAEHAPGTVAAFAQGLTLVTVSCDVEYLRECRALDEIDIHMSLRHLAGNRVEMAFDYVRAGSPPELVARGHQTVACMRRTGDGGDMEPEPVPEELLIALRPFSS